MIRRPARPPRPELEAPTVTVRPRPAPHPPPAQHDAPQPQHPKGGLMHARTTTITTLAAATILALTACSSPPTASPAASKPPTPSAPATTTTTTTAATGPNKACHDKVYALLLENITNGTTPDARPAECDGITDTQWTAVVEEQSRKLEAAGKAAITAGSSGGGSEEATEVVFKVWGSAPSGASITYGSDSENLEGSSRLPMTKKLKAKPGALYFHITAQLLGGGDIHCSVTYGDETKDGQAKGGYNICSAQINRL